jgi:transcriptional regulator with GAF, ATPase, and Fis domain
MRDRPAQPAARSAAPGVPTLALGERVLTAEEMKQLERENVSRALERAGGRVYGSRGAAELLGLRPSTLLSRMKAFGLKRVGENPAG